MRTVGVWATSATDIELASLMARFGIDRVRARYPRFTELSAMFGFPPVLLAMATAPLLLRLALRHFPRYAERLDMRG